MSEIGKFIAMVLQDVVQGVLLAQGSGVPAGLPDGVEFILALENGDVQFVVPLSNMLFDAAGSVVTYTHVSNSKN